MMGWGVIAGCAIGAILFIFVFETSRREKQVVGAIYVLTWIIDYIIRTDCICFGLIGQIILCIYFAFWYKIQQL